MQYKIGIITNFCGGISVKVTCIVTWFTTCTSVRRAAREWCWFPGRLLGPQVRHSASLLLLMNNENILKCRESLYVSEIICKQEVRSSHLIYFFSSSNSIWYQSLGFFIQISTNIVVCSHYDHLMSRSSILLNFRPLWSASIPSSSLHPVLTTISSCVRHGLWCIPDWDIRNWWPENYDFIKI